MVALRKRRGGGMNHSEGRPDFHIPPAGKLKFAPSLHPKCDCSGLPASEGTSLSQQPALAGSRSVPVSGLCLLFPLGSINLCPARFKAAT